MMGDQFPLVGIKLRDKRGGKGKGRAKDTKIPRCRPRIFGRGRNGHVRY